MNITRIVLIKTSDPVDFTYSLVPAGLFSGLEITIGIITGCLPTFGPLIWKRGGNGTGYSSGTSRSTGPKKPITNQNRSLYQSDFERLGEDDVPLRTIAQGGGSDPTLAGKDGITVRTDMQMYSTHVGSKPLREDEIV
jgi:hypothetical protein